MSCREANFTYPKLTLLVAFTSTASFAFQFVAYAALPGGQQNKIFFPVPDNCRKVVFATNIAETSLTVDGIAYVIDPGLVKQRNFNASTGIDSLLIVPISRVAAKQRAGRAGRTRKGVCYRLYPKSVSFHHTEYLSQKREFPSYRISILSILESLELVLK